MSLMDELKAAKEQAALRDFEVTITETLEMKVTVKAKSREEAEELVEARWNDSDYILDADHFTGASFSAEPVQHGRSRDAER